MAKRRFEGFIHQKIDPNLQRALDFLSKSWGVSIQAVPTRAIQQAATDEALTREIKYLKERPKKNAKTTEKTETVEVVRTVTDETVVREKERLAAEVHAMAKTISSLQKKHAKVKMALSAALTELEEK